MSLQNLISFEDGGSFIVEGDLLDYELSTDRTAFKFSNAKVDIAQKFTLEVPPIGSGYFETMYVNEKYRLSKDSRGDYSISERIWDKVLLEEVYTLHHV